MKIAASQLLRAIRGRRSQIAFARRLGYRANPITDWETGRRFPTAGETLRACARVGIDVRAAFTSFLSPAAEALGEGDDGGVARWLEAIRGSTPVQEVAARMGRTRFVVGRWLSGVTRPRLPDFLELVDVLTGRVPDLVAALVDISTVPELSARYTALEAARALAFEEPWTELILRVMETDAYLALTAHVPGWIARRIGVDGATEARCLARLEEAGVIEAHRGALRVVGALSVDTRRRGVYGIMAHWNAAASKRILEGRMPGDLFSYNVVSLSLADFQRLKDLQRQMYREMRAIVAASLPCETTAVINLQILEFPVSERENDGDGR